MSTTTTTTTTTVSTSTSTSTTTTAPQYCYLNDILHYLEYEELARLSSDRDFQANDALAAPITSTDTSITLSDASTFLSAGRILIDQEEIDYTTKVTNTLSGLTRGVNYTQASNHLINSIVQESLVINQSNIDYCIRDAQAEIETYLGTIYTNLPFTDIPLSIRKCTIDLAIYNLYTRRKSIPPQWQAQYAKQLAFLQRIVEGTLVLENPDPNSKTDKIYTNTYADDLTFTIGSKTLGTVGSLDEY